MHYREVRSGEAVASTRQNQVPHTRPCDRRGTGQDYQTPTPAASCAGILLAGEPEHPRPGLHARLRAIQI